MPRGKCSTTVCHERERERERALQYQCGVNGAKDFVWGQRCIVQTSTNMCASMFIPSYLYATANVM